MRVNFRGLDDSTNMFGEFKFPKCDTAWREQAEKLMDMVSCAGYSAPDYHNVKTLEDGITLQYWYEYDSLAPALQSKAEFERWYLNQATSPELIMRALRWLRQNSYVFLKPEVELNAQNAAQRIRQSVKRE